MKINDFGTLYIVATPIGNLRDISLRAVDVLQSVDAIAAEDTRHSSSLLQHYQIKTPIFSLHEHNERERSAAIIAQLKEGRSIALISDAGTPLISDPGYHLVKEVRQHGIRIVPIPGACAAIAALSVAGLPTDRFLFEGFLPAKSKQRKDNLQRLASEPRTLVFYESPHRIHRTLLDMVEIFGKDRLVVMARELTKTFETIHADTMAGLLQWVLRDKNQTKGEIVILVHGNKETVEAANDPAVTRVLSILLAELPLKQAVDLASKMTELRKNDIYELALQLKNQSHL